MAQFIRIGSSLVNVSQIRLVYTRTHGPAGARVHALFVSVGGGDAVSIQIKKEEEVAVLRAVGFPGSVEDLANEAGVQAGVALGPGSTDTRD